MFQTLAKFEVIVSDKSFQFLCDANSPLEAVKEAIFQIQKSVAMLEDQIKAAQESAKKAEEERKNQESIPQDSVEVNNDQQPA